MNTKLISLSTVLYLCSSPLFVKAQTLDVCLRRAEARRHTAMAQARYAYQSRVSSCQTMPSPDRAERCIQAARITFERDSQAARARYSQDVQACRNQS